MSALQTLIRPARAEANRRNAQKSTGPRTEAGKARSRGNACKHGLTGAGIALPTEDELTVRERFAALVDQFQPQTPLGSYYVGRIALATVRTERAARHEAAALSHRVRHAAEEWAIAQAAAIDSAVGRLRDGSGRSARRDLLRTTAGIDRLRTELLNLRRGLILPELLWSQDLGQRLDSCLGIDPDPLIPSRVEALTTALLGGGGDLLTSTEIAAIAEAGGTTEEHAKRGLVGLIDEELVALAADRAAIDPTVLEADRAEAADRSLFDPSPAATLARRYEAAAAREVDRALRLLLAVEADAPAQFESESEPETEAEIPSHTPVVASTDDAESPEVGPTAPSSTDPAPSVKPGQPIQASECQYSKPLPVNALPDEMASFGDPSPSLFEPSPTPLMAVGLGGDWARSGVA